MQHRAWHTPPTPTYRASYLRSHACVPFHPFLLSCTPLSCAPLSPAVLNVLGFACYTQFNLSLFASSHVQQEYMARFKTADIPVELNDVVFGLHAFIMSSVMLIQCLIYEKHHTQAVSVTTSVSMVGSVATTTVLAVLLAVRGEGTLPYTWLDL